MASNIIIWPRHEVLQLINPSFAQSGKILTHSLLFDTVKHLSKLQSPDRSISFEQWIMTAKDLLKWTDNASRLFWDMLHMASWYKCQSEWSQHSDFINIGNLVVFLVMHSPYNSLGKQNSPRTAYDTMWPSQDSLLQQVYSPPTSPHSQKKGSNMAPTTMPVTSPRTSRSNKKLSNSPSYAKSTSHHLQAIKEKLHMLLRAVSIIDSVLMEHDDFNERSRFADDSNDGSKMNSYDVSMFAMDSLGLILSGSTNRAKEVTNLSSLYKFWPVSSRSSLYDEEFDNVHSSSAPMISSVDAIEWIENRITLNDHRYPVSLGSGEGSARSSSPSSEMVNNSVDSMGEALTIGNDVPMRKLFTCNHASSGGGASSILLTEPPSVFTDLNTTIMHIAVVDGCGVLHKGGSFEDGLKGDPLSDSRRNSSGTFESVEQLSDEVHRVEGHVSCVCLPLLLIQGCFRSNLYLLAAYSSCTINSCFDSDVIIGAVAGTVILMGCERLKLTVVCRKLILINCYDCDVQLATLTPTIVSGVCRGVTLGPFNTAYRMLRMHLRLANLNSLFNSVDANAWPLVYDCNTCLETTSAGAGSSHGTVAFDDSLSSGLSTLPRPPDTVTTIQSPYKFSVVTIPYYPENQPFELCPIQIPEEFIRSEIERKQHAIDLQNHVNNLLSKSQYDSQKQVFKNLLVHKFMEWTAKTGKSVVVTDLIKIDNSDDDVNSGRKEEFSY